MPVIANCPSCGGPLSETSVLALAPVCSHCRGVIINIGGTLGLTGVYGVNDQSITRHRVEADLSVLRETLVKYNGTKEACKEQLNWGVERYAKLPQPPELLILADVPRFWTGLLLGPVLGPVSAALWIVVFYIVVWIFKWPYIIVSVFFRTPEPTKNPPSWIEITDFFYFPKEGWLQPENFIVNMVVYGGGVMIGVVIGVVIVLASLIPHFITKVNNGKKPQENAQRQKAYEKAVAAAIKVAEPIKAAQDHRLRVQISELEGLENTVRKIEVEVNQQLKTLQ